MTEQIPAEAVEAAAQVLCEDDFGRAAWARLEAGTRKMTFARYCGVARRALAAALPYLAQPAHAVPSVEEVAEAVRSVQGVPFVGPKQREIAAAILALFASQPTVAEVREQALLDYAAYLEMAAHDLADMMTDEDEDENTRTIAAIRAYARIARGETKEANRG